MKHEGGWQLTQPAPGLFRWESPLGRVYWTRGEPIAPDLPEAVPDRRREVGSPEVGSPEVESDRDVGPPIFDPRVRRHQPPPPPPAANDPPGEPPF